MLTITTMTNPDTIIENGDYSNAAATPIECEDYGELLRRP